MSNYITKQCEVCGKDFTFHNNPSLVNKRKNCSVECRRMARTLKPRKLPKTYTKNCAYCGNEFTTKTQDVRFCSIKCSALNRPHPKDPSKRSIFICQWCGKEFEEWTYRNPTMCSKQCNSEYGAKQPKPNARKPERFIALDCEVCAKKYIVPKTQNENGRKSRYCSVECRGIAHSEKMKGEGNHNYKGGTEYNNRGESWSRQRRLAFKRDGGKCQICGYRHKTIGKKRRLLDVHHIIPYKIFKGDHEKANELSNLITLCRSCHAKVERHELPCPRKFF